MTEMVRMVYVVKVRVFECSTCNGCFTTQHVADKVESFIRLYYEEELGGGIEVKQDQFADTLIATPAGLRFKAETDGKIVMVEESRTYRETIRIMDAWLACLKKAGSC